MLVDDSVGCVFLVSLILLATTVLPSPLLWRFSDLLGEGPDGDLLFGLSLTNV